MDQTTLLILSATAAITHTLIPDHEIPLAMIGRAQNWSIKKMAGVTLIAGIIHISISMALGILALVMSVAVESIEGWALAGEKLSAFILVAFGGSYTILALKRRSGHGHTHGGHSHEHEQVGAGVNAELEEKATFGMGAWIVAIVGITPCVTLIPIMFAAVPYGAQTTLWVMLVYAVSTIGVMVILTSISLKAIQYITKLQKIERHLEIFIGLAISIVGLYIILEDVLVALVGI